MSKEYLDLPMYGIRSLSINQDRFAKIKEELNEFLIEEDYMNNHEFARKVMFSQEIKSNNLVEGITDDLTLIQDIINGASKIKDDKQRKRIINLYYGYNYIINNKDINENTLRELYGILSNGLLEKSDLDRMGSLYREAPVYILKNGRLDLEPDQGIPYDLVNKYMNEYFNYINIDNYFGNTSTDEFIKSQIMHFYLVYIHPYFDVNGRTSRTTAMWYLLNKEAYPYIIFNRAITFDMSNYDKAIMDTKTFSDMSFFIRYMMENVKKELEKELIMHQIKGSSSSKLEAIDYQTLIYLLSMNGELNVLNFGTMYKRFNDAKPIREIYDEMILPLIDKDVLEVVRTTNKEMFNGYSNEVLRINPNRYDTNNPKIKKLRIN